jgi:tetratricopeptide (TPR) repeat protein
MFPHTYRGGFIYPASGKYTKSIEEPQRAIDINPDAAIGYLILAANYLDVDQLDQAEGALHRASEPGESRSVHEWYSGVGGVLRDYSRRQAGCDSRACDLQ